MVENTSSELSQLIRPRLNTIKAKIGSKLMLENEHGAEAIGVSSLLKMRKSHSQKESKQELLKMSKCDFMAERDMVMSLKKDEVIDLVGTVNHSRIGRRLNYD